ncbi:MAG: right-handed parallel beta-helix repeat-containing protein [Deltaproteobacteria bacterium]|nr:right-handed parallel beta-helix repeat-containing protein [Deltaproteobacteria bacterium]
MRPHLSPLLSLSLSPATAAAALLLASCSVPLEGAPCADDSECPSGQHCGTSGTSGTIGTCVNGEREAAADASAPVADAGPTAPDAGPACTSDPACSAADRPGCNSSGTQLGICREIEPGCLKLEELTDCPAPQTCNGGRCQCPSGCAAGETRCKDPHVLQACDVAGNEICGDWVSTSCPTGLECGRPKSSEPYQCLCPAATGGALYVDPAGDSALVPTGAESPPSCRLPRLTDALSRAAAGTKVVLAGADEPSPPWRPSTQYAAGTKVTPRQLTGHLYQVTIAGISGAVEPEWPIAAGAEVSDGSVVTWREAGTLRHVVLASETLPLTIPAGVAVTSQYCSVDEGCDGRAHSVSLGAASSALPAALILGAGASLEGLALQNAGVDATALATCDTGTVSVRDLVLVGNQGTRVIPTGLNVGTGCTASITRLAAQGFSEAALWIDGGTATIQSSRFTANNVGLRMSGGRADVSSSRFEANSVAGVVVTGTGTEDATFERTSFTQNVTDGIVVNGGRVRLDECEVSSNRSVGVRVEGRALAPADTVVGLSRIAIFDNVTAGAKVSNATVSFEGNDIYRNGTTGGGGVVFDSQPSHLTLFRKNRLHDNYVTQLGFHVEAATGASPGAGRWDLSAQFCDDANQIFCYPTGAKGLLVAGSASSVAGILVDARKVVWQNSPPSEGVDYVGPAGTITLGESSPGGCAAAGVACSSTN